MAMAMAMAMVIPKPFRLAVVFALAKTQNIGD